MLMVVLSSSIGSGIVLRTRSAFAFLDKNVLKSPRKFHHAFAFLCGNLITFMVLSGWGYRFARVALGMSKGDIGWLRQIHKGNFEPVGLVNIELIFTGTVGIL